MAIEDTFGYRFVRMSLILLNCLVLIRLISLLLQFPHFFDPTIVLFILLIGSNFMAAIVGAIREHRITVLITGSLTLIMFLSLLFTNKENKNLNLSLFTLLAIAAQSLIFSEMLKERQIFVQRQNLDLWNTATAAAAAGTNSNATNRRTTTANGPLTAVVVYQPSGTNHRGQTTGGIFMVDPILGTELPKDPPPSYFSASCPPPKYEDAIKLNALNIVPTLPQPQQQQQAASSTENQSSDNNNNNQIPSDTSATASSANTSITLSPSSSVDSSVDNNNNNEQQQQQSNNEGSNIINSKNSRKTTETISAAVAAAAAAAATSANAQQQQQQQKQNNDNNSSDDQQQQ